MPRLFLLQMFFIITLFDMRTCTELFDVNMVNDIVNHFHCNWIIIQTCEKIDNPTLKLFKEIGRFINVFMTIFNWEDFLPESEWHANMRPLVLITCRSCRDCLQPINKFNDNNLMASFVWLAMKNNNTDDLKIPIDCLFLLIEQNSPGFFTMTEVYRLSSRLVETVIGNWSFQTGLAFTAIPFEERRSNFYGENITTLVEPDNSLNRLYIIYDFYTFCYWDLSKRLNFTIRNTSDPKEAYEVSILMQWMDMKNQDHYLKPLYFAWQVILLKDVGVTFQLDSYFKPFSQAVWIVILLTVLLAGFASYAVARILARATKNKTSLFTVDVYIYQSLYVFLQRSGGQGKFTAQKIIVISQWILSMCLISYYSATFISFISVVIPKPPFTTVDGILQQKTHNIVSAKHLSAGTIDNLAKSPDVKLRKLYKNHFDPVRNVNDDPVNEFCARDNYIFISSEFHLKSIKNSLKYRHCHISDTYIKLSVRYMCWSVSKQKQYQRILNFYLEKLNLAGTLKGYFLQKRIYKKVPEPTSFRGITFHDTLILFIIFTTGLLISVFILLLEILHKKVKIKYSFKG